MLVVCDRDAKCEGFGFRRWNVSHLLEKLSYISSQTLSNNQDSNEKIPYNISFSDARREPMRCQIVDPPVILLAMACPSNSNNTGW